jgi:putative ABC transport system permease protein
MIFRFVKDSIRRAPRRKALLIAAIAMGSAVATSMLGVMLSIGDKVNRELRQVGSNIVVTAKAASLTGGIGSETATAAGGAAYIPEGEVGKLNNIFWHLNVTGTSPSLLAHDGALQIEGVVFQGLKGVNPAWVVRGHWANNDKADCMVGDGIAIRNHWKQGDKVTLFGSTFQIAGLISSGDDADDRVFLPLARVQELTHRPRVVDRIDIAALTKPEDSFARKDPKAMTPTELERWHCTNYVASIALDIEETLPGTQARAVRRIADSEGKILDNIGGLMALITLAALLSAGLTVWSLTATTMMERRGEIAIMQAIGAGRGMVATLLGVEISLIGLAGGLIGATAGVFLAKYVGRAVFHDAIEVSPVLPLLIMLAAVAIALAGAAQPLRRAIRLEPAVILREGV